MNKKYIQYFCFYIAFASIISCALTKTKTKRAESTIKVKDQGRIIEIPLEKYVASVLAGEVHKSWPMASLKAQAVAARTFALLRMKERRHQPYHVTSSVMDQVYKPKTVDVFTKAAQHTRGLVLTIDNTLAETSFHSTCGGRTASSSSVWARPNRHLTGTSCGHCQDSPTYTWNIGLDVSSLEKIFNHRIKKIRIKSRWEDGRAKIIELSGGTPKLVPAHKFRMTVGPMLIKSTWITSIDIEGRTANFRGRGFGHGVGMCQYGALGMAKKGSTFPQIIYHYYPNTKIKKLY